MVSEESHRAGRILRDSLSNAFTKQMVVLGPEVKGPSQSHSETWREGIAKFLSHLPTSPRTRRLLRELQLLLASSQVKGQPGGVK